MSRVHANRQLIEECRAIEYIAGVIGNRVEEFEPYVFRGGFSDYEIHFPSNSAIFRISRVIELVDGELSFQIALALDDNRTVIWETTYDKISLSDFDTKMVQFMQGGFPDGGDGFLWYTAERAPKSFEVQDDIFTPMPQYFDPGAGGADQEQSQRMEFGHNSFGGDEGDEGSTGEQYEGSTVEQYEGSTEGDSGSSSEEELHEYGAMVGGRFTAEMFRVQPCIVPSGINQIRVVALKYEGNVIAFRFKTNVGAFDMRKSVAMGYGLGSFKTETFITLKSVNGMLMSDSERKRQICVPDVSDCKEDCDRLMSALFGN